MLPLPEPHLRALRKIHSLLQGQEGLVWALTGSASFILQGMDLTPHDIDLIADERSAYRIGEILSDYVVKPVGSDSAATYIHSHFGRFLVEGVEVDVMGSPRRMNLDGSWGGPDFLPPLIQWLTYLGMSLPVLPLAYEAQAYRLLRREGRAEQIEAFLERKREKSART
jgi:hypothetical protein